jgi:hypothetical protein
MRGSRATFPAFCRRGSVLTGDVLAVGINPGEQRLEPREPGGSAPGQPAMTPARAWAFREFPAVFGVSRMIEYTFAL